MTKCIMRFNKTHYKALSNIREVDKKVLAGIDIEMTVDHYSKLDSSYSYFVNGQIIAITGSIPVWSGVSELWMLTTDYVDENKLFFYKSTLKLLNYDRIKYNTHRYQCAVHTDNVKSMNWLSKMGFESEGIMKAYSPDKTDYIRMSKTWLS